MSDFSCIINWIKNGCDPKEAVEELELMQVEHDEELRLLKYAYSAIDQLIEEYPKSAMKYIHCGLGRNTLGNIRAELNKYKHKDDNHELR